MLRTGVDLIEIERVAAAVQRHGQRFLERVYTPQEQMECAGRIASLAARFAAKEAVSKALGTGIGPVGWKEIEVIYGPAHQPILRLHGQAQSAAHQLDLGEWAVSLSHTASHAIALVVAREALKKDEPGRE